MVQSTNDEKIAEITFDPVIWQNFHVTVMGKKMQQQYYKHALKIFRISGLLLFMGVMILFLMPEEGVHGIVAVFFFLLPIVMVISFFGFMNGIFQIRKLKKKVLCGIQVEITRKTGIFPLVEGYCAGFFAKDIYSGYENEFHTGDINKYQTFEVGDQVTLIDYISVKKLKEYGII